MNFWVGVTDNDWFNYLSRAIPEEVNFWQPRGAITYSSLSPGSLFLFKLRRPHNHIAGGGFFVRSTSLPISFVWDAFKHCNGAPDFRSFAKMIDRVAPIKPRSDPTIGCTVLSQTFFWPREKWIENPIGWGGSIVRGRYYDTENEEGALLWAQVRERLQADVVRMPTPERYGEPRLISPRLGQGSFRVLVTDAYARRCAITGESTLPVLEAAHIVPFSENGAHSVPNGLLLRSDFHRLFDLGLITVTPEMIVEVSSRIREDWFNGKAYYRLNGQRLASVPERKDQQPSAASLQWHNEQRFQA
jgi:putative restriction endonuclease